MMLKLTKFGDRSTVYVAPSHIAVVEAVSAGTRLQMSHGEIVVKETVAEIMAMPEMVRHQNPAYVVSAGPLTDVAPITWAPIGQFAEKVVTSHHCRKVAEAEAES